MVAYDRGFEPRQRSSTAIVRVQVLDVNDNRPTFPFTQPARHVAEGTPRGTEVMVAEATDTDINHELTYYFLSEGNPGENFAIDPLSGKITIAKVLDFEERRQYTLQVGVSDSLYTDVTTINVFVDDVNDNAPVFDETLYTVRLQIVKLYFIYQQYIFMYLMTSSFAGRRNGGDECRCASVAGECERR